MLYQAQAAVATEPWLAIAPGAFILMTTVSVSVIGDRLAGTPSYGRLTIDNSQLTIYKGRRLPL